VIALVSLVFFSIFHIIGGAIAGYALRQLRIRFSIQMLFTLFAGVIFGGAPLFQNSALASSSEYIFVVTVQIIVFASAILLALFLPEAIVTTFKSEEMISIGLGGVMLFGAFLGTSAIFEMSPSGAIALAVFFGGVGVWLIGRGLRQLFKS
jgi:hypothetical protein